MSVIPLLKPSCSQEEIDRVTEVLKSGWWGLGGVTEQFEKEFAEKIGVKYAVAIDNCTDALELALRVHGIEEGDEVIVPALTFASTALVALHLGCKIVFADIDEKTLCIDWDDVIRKITPRTKAIVPVHYGGNSAFDKERFISYQENPRITIIEDCAHACGNPTVAKHRTSCWSFHAVKNLATGDGGMITTNDEEIYKKLLPMRWCGIDRSTWERSQKKYGWDYDIETIGYKAHMNDITAAIGLAQLHRLDEMNKKRKELVGGYRRNLYDLDWITLPKQDENSSNHLFVVRVAAEDRNRFIDHMLAHGVSAGVHYKPLNTYPIFPSTPLPITDRVWQTLVTLPLFNDMTDEEFVKIIETIRSFKP